MIRIDYVFQLREQLRIGAENKYSQFSPVQYESLQLAGNLTLTQSCDEGTEIKIGSQIVPMFFINITILFNGSIRGVGVSINLQILRMYMSRLHPFQASRPRQ